MDFPIPLLQVGCDTRSVFKCSQASLNSDFVCAVGWDCRRHRLHLCRGVRPPPNECPGYDTKQSDDEAPVMRELWGMRSTPSLPLILGPLCPRMVAPNRALSMG